MGIMTKPFVCLGEIDGQRLLFRSPWWAAASGQSLGTSTLTTEQNAKISIPPYTWIKLLRAHGGCLGARSRRRAWWTAISLGELSNKL